MTNAFDNIGWGDETTGSVRLPFGALTIRSLNGDAKMKGVTPSARYFGGWAYGTDEAKKLIADGDLRVDPSWAVYEASGEKGDYLESAHRLVNVAVIKGRSRWVNQKTRQFDTKYFDGARMHLQYLVGLFKRDEGKVLFSGMAMLTAKGHQATNLQKAIEEYANHIRSATAGEPKLSGLPRPAWIMTIGTFGEKPDFVTVGKGTQTSAITPLKALLPQSGDELLRRRVPDEVLDFMGEKYTAASEWLNAWKQPGRDPQLILEAAGGVEVDDRPF